MKKSINENPALSETAVSGCYKTKSNGDRNY